MRLENVVHQTGARQWDLPPRAAWTRGRGLVLVLASLSDWTPLIGCAKAPLGLSK
ncbi:hypothetical protein RA210_U250050 [Rubrivivax sp. A210]|nr:hypothetical protein RA210_U250050 [Rubrivivax sp. A210]